MEPQNTSPTANERKGMALASLIIGAIALLMSLLTGWRMAGMGLGLLGLIVSLYCLRRSRKTGAPAGMALPGFICSVLAIVASAYFLVRIGTAEPAPIVMPAEDPIAGQ